MTWQDEALYSMASEVEFRRLVDRVRDSIEPIELASLFATFRGEDEHARSQNLVVNDSDLPRTVVGAADLDTIDGLGPLRSTHDPIAGTVIDFFAFYIWRGDASHAPTVNFVRWHVELGPPGLSWRSSPVAAVPFAPDV